MSDQTFLLTGQKIAKNSVRINLIGDLDELSAILQISLCQYQQKNKAQKIIKILQKNIKNLTKISSLLAQKNDLPNENILLDTIKEINNLKNKLPKIKKFLTFEFSLSAVFLNLARTVCRRCERTCWKLQKPPQNIAAFLNKFSFLLWCLASFDVMIFNFQGNVLQKKS